MVDFTFEFDYYFSFVQGRTRRANAAHCVKTIMPVLPFSEITFSIELR